MEGLSVIPEALARIINPLLGDGLIQRVEGKIMGNSRSAPEGTWVRGGEIEFPCKYKVYGPHQHRRAVREKLKNKRLFFV